PCFFFQAEDGIRDRNVTGVQTCALPISLQDLEKHPKHIQDYYQFELGKGLTANTVIHRHANIRKCLQYAFQIGLIKSNPADRVEIGRASCRERGESRRGDGGWEERRAGE